VAGIAFDLRSAGSVKGLDVLSKKLDMAARGTGRSRRSLYGSRHGGLGPPSRGRRGGLLAEGGGKITAKAGKEGWGSLTKKKEKYFGVWGPKNSHVDADADLEGNDDKSRCFSLKKNLPGRKETSLNNAERLTLLGKWRRIKMQSKARRGCIS